MHNATMTAARRLAKAVTTKRPRARACHGVLIDTYEAARVAEHYARVHLRESKKAERSHRWQKVLLDRPTPP
jgi:hypothetical protein